ncbi:MAG: flagellar type III secretion system protein FlhB [Alphaproteobacteria bacterium]|nr:flagellar type III secretion system protein FlhB [Alphaproteobacteria bacterium]
MANDDEDASSKTEEPTQKRLDKAKEEGQVPLSRDARHWLSLLVATLLLVFLGAWGFSSIKNQLVGFIEHPEQFRFTPFEIGQLTVQIVTGIGAILLVPFFAGVLAAVVGTFSQTGTFVSIKKLRVRGDNLNPLSGAKRLFGANNFVEFLKSLAKLTLIAGFAIGVLWGFSGLLIDSPRVSVFELTRLLFTVLVAIMVIILAIYFILAAVDVAWQRYSTRQKLRMSPREVKEERKQAEGDPLIRQRIARLRQERRRQSLVDSMSRADVVVVNPTHYAVALEYKSATMDAPVVVAKGTDFIALNMRTIANERNIPIIENPPLARALYDACVIDSPIEPEFYQTVAEVIRYVWNLKGKR